MEIRTQAAQHIFMSPAKITNMSFFGNSCCSYAVLHPKPQGTKQKRKKETKNTHLRPLNLNLST